MALFEDGGGVFVYDINEDHSPDGIEYVLFIIVALTFGIWLPIVGICYVAHFLSCLVIWTCKSIFNLAAKGIE